MNLFLSIVSLLKDKEDFALATILSRSGSAPRAVGTRMIVRSDRSILGTVGGGILEAQVQKLAGQLLVDRSTMVKKFVLTAENAGSMGMICY
jgi:xanthine dehydrogenase accessory factor